MNETSLIGGWAMRITRRGFEYGKAHLIESEVADRVVTKCGRELPLTTDHGTIDVFWARRLDPRCLQCGSHGD